MKCRGHKCGKELNPEKDEIYNFMGLPVCEECVRKENCVDLNSDFKIEILSANNEKLLMDRFEDNGTILHKCFE